MNNLFKDHDSLIQYYHDNYIPAKEQLIILNLNKMVTNAKANLIKSDPTADVYHTFIKGAGICGFTVFLNNNAYVKSKRIYLDPGWSLDITMWGLANGLNNLITEALDEVNI